MRVWQTPEVILLNDKILQERRDELGGSVWKVYIANQLIHEFGHVAALSGEFEERETPTKLLTVRRDGVKQYVFEQDINNLEGGVNYSVFLDWMNEAINDEWTEEITREFCKATGFASESDVNSYFK